jgi:prolyl-tRNA editing enzyme YbaK/EbsC (Cys-tRNA(Pro) deacylase)
VAQARDVERVTGYQLGAVSVLGFRRDDIACYLDRRVLDLEQVVISAGRPDLGLALSPGALERAWDRVERGDFCQEG